MSFQCFFYAIPGIWEYFGRFFPMSLQMHVN